MGKRILSLILLALLLFLQGSDNEAAGEGSEPESRKNIVFLFVDDMRVMDINHQPGLKEVAYDQGVSFKNGFADISLCCPSRASILTGEYPHNHQIETNALPGGGYVKFKRTGGTERAYNNWFDRRGYHTSYVGKYMNSYDNPGVPPGWDNWYAWLSAPTNREASDNGRRVKVPNAIKKDADIVAEKMVKSIDEANRKNQPFLAVGSIYFPHKPAIAPDRHYGKFSGVKYPKRPNFNEKYFQDKPEGMSGSPRLGRHEIKEQAYLWRRRQESLLAVEDAYRKVVEKLRETGELENTYIVFTSDQGYHLGEHRVGDNKRTSYQEAVRVPMTVRGPGIKPGVVRNEMVLNHDIAQTMANLAGLNKNNTTDGKPFDRLLFAQANEKPYKNVWRKRFLNYNYRHYFKGMNPNVAMITRGYMYSESPGGNEYYDHKNDPYERNNNYKNLNKNQKQKLESQMNALKGCKGEECRKAERR